jgi:hypothetical protein
LTRELLLFEESILPFDDDDGNEELVRWLILFNDDEDDEVGVVLDVGRD